METKSHSSTQNNHFKLYSELELHEFKDQFVIRSLQFPDRAFSITRSDGIFHKIQDEVNWETASKVYTIFGVAGTIQLLSGTYVLVITSRKEVGTFFGYPVFRVMSMKFLSCTGDLRNLNNQQKKDDSYFQTLLRVVEETPGLYYSYETDITLNLQRRYKMTNGWMSKPIWKQADPRFVWNRNILEELIENKLDDFIVPLLQGSFQIGQLKLNNLTSTITLISRRCTRRLGTRMWRRGANLQGDTANFIETEQLLEYDGFKSSFLQVRGSIPLLWEQIVDLSYKPRLAVIEHEDTSMVVKRHFHDLLQRYGDTIAVDLTDKHGNESLLNLAFAKEMEKLAEARYVSFDFHQRCKNSNFECLKLLYDEIAEEFEKQGYFLQTTEGELIAEQKGVIRSNCIDCLDRTNVTQSYLARISLKQQLQQICALTSSECICTFTDDEDLEIFRNLWVNQGDEISLEYSGTNALKGDIVRYGKQTMSGLIKDGISALSRYYLNNFQDGVRQDAMDLICGNYTVNGNSPSPFQLNKFESRTLFPVASALLIGGLTVTSITLNRGFKPGLTFRIALASVKDLDQEQLQRIDRLKMETRSEERELENQMARIQESVAGPAIRTRRSGSESLLVNGRLHELESAIEVLRREMEVVLGNADMLRTRTAEKVVEILTPVQTVKFLAAVSELFIKIRMFGWQIDGADNGEFSL